MSIIERQDTNGVKPLLQVGELGYDNFPAGGDEGRVFVGTGTENIGLAKKTEVMVVDSKADAHIARVDNPHNVTKTQVGLGNVDNTSDANKPVSTATQTALNTKVGTTGNQTIAGIKTFSSNIVGNITGNSATATKLSTARNNYKGVTDSAVVGELMWKNYGNNHTIFDASNSTTPTGVAKNNANPDNPWVPSYPTLMGYNGIETYGVRVDSSRYAESATRANTINNSGNSLTFNWSGQSGQPTWLYGGNDPSNAYVYNPSNFSVNYANSARYAETAAVGTNNTQIATTAFVQANGASVNNVKTALNASGTAPIYACRAWVNFNGTGTVAIRASGNVSSIADNGAGIYQINFTSPMPDNNYSYSLAVCNGEDANGLVIQGSYVTQLTNSLRVRTEVPNSFDVDALYVMAQIFR